MVGIRILRWSAMLMALVLLAAACSSDGPNLADVVDDSGAVDVPDAAPTDAAPSDATPPGSEPAESTGPDIDGSDLPPEALAATTCADVEEAFASVGGIMSGGLGAPVETDLEADFNSYRAGLEALRAEAPELGGDIDTALAGLDAIGAAMAEFDWEVGNLSDPQDVAALAAVMSNPEALGMFEAMTNIATWVAGNCLG